MGGGGRESTPDRKEGSFHLSRAPGCQTEVRVGNKRSNASREGGENNRRKK